MRIFSWLHSSFVKPNWEKILTPCTKQVLALSRRAAVEQNCQFVEVEHLLAGILRLNQGLAFDTLKNAGLEPSDLGTNLKSLGDQANTPIEAINIPYRPSVKTCLSLAWKEAKTLGNDFCGTEHLLLGILRYRKGVTHEMLKSHGLTLERTRELVEAAQTNQATQIP